MTTARNIELANIHITFGDLKLLDLVEDVVVPALLDGRRVREYGQTDYYLIDTDIVQLHQNNDNANDVEVAIVGRIVKKAHHQFMWA